MLWVRFQVSYILPILLTAINRYTYSLVFAADIYQTVFKEDPLDATRGDRYRKSILQPGGSREELDSLEEFLGRPPNSDAFMKELFGGSESRGHV
jgi:Zn-dependent oligopeptidase